MSRQYTPREPKKAKMCSPSVTGEVEAFVGTDLSDPGFFYGIDLRAAYRPRQDVEIFLGLAHGRSFGRSGDAQNSTTIEVGATLRW